MKRLSTALDGCRQYGRFGGGAEIGPAMATARPSRSVPVRDLVGRVRPGQEKNRPQSQQPGTAADGCQQQRDPRAKAQFREP